jgi:amidase
VWVDDPRAVIDDEVRGPILEAVAALRAAGAKVDFAARPAIDPDQAHEVYQRLLQANMAARRPDYEELLARRARLDPGDDRPGARWLRQATASYKEVYDAINQRERLRWAWRSFFDRVDVLVAPVTCTAAFPHDHSEPLGQRTLTVNGQPAPYFAMLFWAGLATAPYLPATCAPVGLTRQGLPVGMQIIGPEMGDRTTIAVAALLAREIGGFRPPPNLA